MYFIGYVLFEIPCNIILKKTTPRFWLPTLAVAWGIVSTLMGVVHNREGFLASRFFLGVTESGLFPGVVFYFSMWYKRRERQFRISLFFSAASLAGAFGGILAYGIGHMGGVVWENGWRWIFILVRNASEACSTAVADTNRRALRLSSSPSARTGSSRTTPTQQTSYRQLRASSSTPDSQRTATQL